MKLGRVYEYAAEDNQRDKEDMIILERALLNEQESINEENPETTFQKCTCGRQL